MFSDLLGPDTVKSRNRQKAETKIQKEAPHYVEVIVRGLYSLEAERVGKSTVKIRMERVPERHSIGGYNDICEILKSGKERDWAFMKSRIVLDPALYFSEISRILKERGLRPLRVSMDWRNDDRIYFIEMENPFLRMDTNTTDTRTPFGEEFAKRSKKNLETLAQDVRSNILDGKIAFKLTTDGCFYCNALAIQEDLTKIGYQVHVKLNYGGLSDTQWTILVKGKC